jgi:hypothetical protein
MLSFLFGVLAGGIAVAYWQGEIRNLRTRHMPHLRDQAADQVQRAERAVIRMVENVSTKTRAGLRSDQSKREGNMAER